MTREADHQDTLGPGNEGIAGAESLSECKKREWE